MPLPTNDKDKRTVVIGAGPAGLSAALELTRHDIAPLVLEKDDIVGGISRTQCYKGYHFDMGGHRFYTKSAEVRKIWEDALGDEFMIRPRLSRIFYKQKFFFMVKLINQLMLKVYVSHREHVKLLKLQAAQ